MRDIKFRVWDGERMFYQYNDFDVISFNQSISKPFQIFEGHTALLDYFFKVSPLMQYTGLKDKNGKEIYEGDIVEAHSHYFDGNFDADNNFRAQVKFSEWASLGLADIKNGDWYEFFDTSHLEEPCEIIGNIYENPELLEGSNG
jgi:uncharacterized phage protein (TIGR01671 family)